MIKNPLEDLIKELCKLPGIGAKSAMRLAFFFLTLPIEEVHKISSAISSTREKITYCKKCYSISLTDRCFVCSDITRNISQLCIVAEPRDLFAIEKTREFKGLYHVLGGLISPIDGIHPETLRIQELIARLKQDAIKEIILAINPTIEGDATILYLSKILEPFQIKLTKLAYGLPIGSNIDYADEITLQKSLLGRTLIN
jgi:recombination protein RecR